MTIESRNGFTLMEVMTTVAIVGVLAAIAIPSYMDYVNQANRSDVKNVLLEDAQFMERNYTESFRYDKNSQGNDITGSSLPGQQSPKTGTALYNISLPTSSLDQTKYTLVATPVVGGRMGNDACGTFSIAQDGTKNVVNATKTVDQCWGK